MVVLCASGRRGTRNTPTSTRLGLVRWKLWSTVPAHGSQARKRSRSCLPALPTWSPTAQKNSFRACQVGVVSAGSVRGARGTSSEALGSLPNTQALTRGKQRPLPEEGTQGEAPVFSPAPHIFPRAASPPCCQACGPASLSKPRPCLDSQPAHLIWT